MYKNHSLLCRKTPPMTNAPLTTRDLVDKKFVTAALILGVIYALIVVLVGNILGKEAAGVAGVALTALATALFKKFETLQFRKMSEEESVWVEVPPINPWLVAVITFAFIGAQIVTGAIIGVLRGVFWPGSSGPLPVVVAGISSALTYFAISYIGAKALVRLRYSTVVFAVLLAQLSNAMVGSLFIGLSIRDLLEVTGSSWIVFDGVALLAVRLARPWRQGTRTGLGDDVPEVAGRS